jgi:hypothetical protein
MAIEFDCPTCGKHYNVSDAMAGKRAKCKACGGTIAVPMPVAADDADPFDPDALAALEAAAGASGEAAYDAPLPRARLPPAGARARRRGAAAAGRNPPPIPRGAAAGGAVALPAWAAGVVGLLGRSRGLPWWGWVGVVVGALLVAGYVSDTGAVVAFYALGGAGLVALAAAAAWAVVVGVALGSRVMVLAVLASPVLALKILVKWCLRHLDGSPDAAPVSDASSWILAASLGGGLGVTAVIAGLASNPRAFKPPFGLGAVGALLVAVCWLPASHRGPGVNPLGRPASRNDGWASRPDRTPPRFAGPATPPRPWDPPTSAPPWPSASVRPPSIPRPRAVPKPAVDAIPTDPGPSDPAVSDPTPVAPVTKGPVPTDSARTGPARGSGDPPPVVKAPSPVAPSPVPPSRVARPPAVSPAVAPPIAAPSAAGPLQAKWGGTWYDVRVVRQERGWTQVEYQSDKTYEWVEPWRTRPAKRPAAADDTPTASPNATWNQPDAPAPAGPPGPKPAR